MKSVKGPFNCMVYREPEVDVASSAETDSTTRRFLAGTGPIEPNPEFTAVEFALQLPLKGWRPGSSFAMVSPPTAPKKIADYIPAKFNCLRTRLSRTIVARTMTKTLKRGAA